MPVSVPTFIKQAWAAVGTKFTIPDNANPTTGRAGWDQGFSPINLTPVAAGGIPPFGQDMNGVLYDITSAIQYIQAGRSFPYNQDFADAIGGYLKGSIVQSEGGERFLSIINENLLAPPSAGWIIESTSSDSGISVFSVPGSASWTVPDVIKSGQKKVEVTVVGGGGGGSGSGGACGGGGGGSAVKLLSLAGVSTVSLVVGVGGSGSTGLSATAGGASSFGAYCSAYGGNAGSASGGFGGTGAGGDLNMKGSDGGDFASNDTTRGSGNGGGSMFGGGGRGGTSGGAHGGNYGGGGGGGTGGIAGGNGGVGVVIIKW